MQVISRPAAVCKPEIRHVTLNTPTSMSNISKPLIKLVNAAKAAKLLSGPQKIIPVDSTWYMPNSPHNALSQYKTEDRIKGAVFFDLDKVCCQKSKYPHMLPPQELFNSSVASLGIAPADPVLVYDRQGIFSAPRTAWTFALYGHSEVYLLDHYPSFKTEVGVESTELPEDPSPALQTYDGIDAEAFGKNYRDEVIEFEELEELVEKGRLTERYTVFDARSNARFTGEAPEPRPGLSSGHVPGANSLPFTRVLDGLGHYKSQEELQEIFAEFGAFDNAIVMCGTGVTAVILKIAIQKAFPEVRVRVYDGSWTEWAQRAPGLIEKTAA